MEKKTFFRWLLLCILVVLPFASVVAKEDDAAWEQVAAGIAFREFVLENPPNHIYVTRMDRNNSSVTIESGIARGRLTGGTEVVSSQAARYDGALNHWAGNWGNRSKVVVAINGFYFGKPHENDGVPWSGQVHSGWYAKRFDDYQTVSGFVWKYDRTAFVGDCIVHPANKQYLDYPTGKTQKIDGINVPRGKDELVIYTPQYDASTKTKNNGVEILVTMDEPTTLALARQAPAGTVKQILYGQGNMPIPFDSLVISAQGYAAGKLVNNLRVGDRLRVAQKIKHYRADCSTANNLDWDRAYTAIGGQFYFLRNGLITQYHSGEAHVRDPRTAVAFNNRFVFFIVVDGRNKGVSEGMRIEELAAFAKNVLKAKFGVALDGGGSSTMVVNGRVVNHPSDANMCFHVYLPFVVHGGGKGQGSMPAEVSAETVAFMNSCRQRPVANSLMMTVVESPRYSHRFLQGFSVKTTARTALRLGPGENYASIASIAAGTSGKVLHHAKGLDGIFAKGSYWWLVAFGGKQGWVAEDALASDKARAPVIFAGDFARQFGSGMKTLFHYRNGEG